MISDLVVGNNVTDEIFYCKSKTLGVARNGSNYCSVTIQDKSGVMDCKIWELNSSIADFEPGDFIRVSGTVGSFRESLQLSITSVDLVDDDSVNIEDFCPHTPYNVEEMLSEVYKFIDSIKSDYLKALLNQFFGNEKFIAKFKNNSAAKQVHHAYVGGLLEHSLAVTRNCDSLAKIYPNINRDLLITVALLHDVGKIKEISAFPENDYTDEGNLLGHIYIGAEMIDIQARKIEGFPKKLLTELKHCILAHHGELEYGSPKKPALIEAMALHIADSADAKLRRFSDLLNETEDNKWSDKNDFFLGTKYRKTAGVV